MEKTKCVVRVTKPATKRAPKCTPYWLVVKDGLDRVEVLTIRAPDGRRALSVFSFRDEAEMFSLLEGLNGGWQVRETSAGELLSLLAGLCAGVKLVALDPLPQMVANGTSDGALGFASVSRERFAERVVGRVAGRVAERVATRETLRGT